MAHREDATIFIKKLCRVIKEPSDLTIWRYTVCSSMSDPAWNNYVRSYNVLAKIESAKINGTWESNLNEFLSRIVIGAVPMNAFLSEEGKQWISDMAKRSR